MPSEFIHRLFIAVPVASVAAARTFLGEPESFPVQISGDGSAPATFQGASMVLTDPQYQAIAAEIPSWPGTVWCLLTHPEEEFVESNVEGYSGNKFDTFLAAAGLDWVAADE